MTLLASFSPAHPHESVLRENMTEALFYTKKVWLSQVGWVGLG